MKLKQEASPVITREQMDWLRFAQGQLDIRQRDFEKEGLQTSALNCEAAASAVGEIIHNWRSA